MGQIICFILLSAILHSSRVLSIPTNLLAKESPDQEKSSDVTKREKGQYAIHGMMEIHAEEREMDERGSMNFGGNVVIVDGDELMTQEEFQLLYGKNPTNDKRAFAEGKIAEKRDGLGLKAYYWPNGEIPYRIKTPSSLNDDIFRAIVDWETFTCLRFNKWTSGRGVSFQSGCGGCYSSLGYQRGTKLQIVCLEKSFTQDCSDSVVHELGHAIGLGHEQSRPDRDKYVTIHTDNIKSKKMASNFGLMAHANTRGIPYDYRSVMHYPGDAFAKLFTKTITTKDPAYQDVIGQRAGVSFLDAKLVNMMYECPELHSCGRFNTQQDYRGTKSRTASGRVCQRWDSQLPHKHYNTPGNYPESDLVNNYCRNPDGEDGGAWCYTTDPNKRWENCDIPQCPNYKSRFIAVECSKSDQVRQLKLECKNGGTISVVRSFYGAWKNKESTCSYTAGDCLDETSHAGHCNGKRSCNVRVEKSSFVWSCGAWHDYLQIHFDCV